jgi:hypothetical protein
MLQVGYYTSLGPCKILPCCDGKARICNNAEVAIKLGRNAYEVIVDKRQDGGMKSANSYSLPPFVNGTLLCPLKVL